ncbi:hypothetical protein [Natronosalvus halobius]|uniref:hypothetical protein n=1 Tax=Natronosalvus halobius TaxID=2953746 RepID=UPI0020A02BB6|nr:hypothetical protein [Natronosalvus halobius]USZ71521.1 hypothetical protein NGM15_15885 [Natronosalvus halobius]
MGIIDRFETEYLDVSSSRATARDIVELVVGSVIFVTLAWVLVSTFVGEEAALGVAVILGIIFTITILSQAYWGLTGRSDYRENDR